MEVNIITCSAYKLPLTSRKRNEYNKVFKTEPMFIICFISLSTFACTIFFIIRHDWIRWAFFYAVPLWICIFIIRKMLSLVKLKK